MYPFQSNEVRSKWPSKLCLLTVNCNIFVGTRTNVLHFSRIPIVLMMFFLTFLLPLLGKQTQNVSCSMFKKWQFLQLIRKSVPVKTMYLDLRLWKRALLSFLTCQRIYSSIHGWFGHSCLSETFQKYSHIYKSSHGILNLSNEQLIFIIFLETVKIGWRKSTKNFLSFF